MAVAIDGQQRQFGGLGFDHMSYNVPQFSNPFASSTGSSTPHSLYATSHHNGLPGSMSMDASRQATRMNSVSSYASVGLTSASSDMLSPAQFKQHSPPTYGHDMSYTSSMPNTNLTTYTTSTPYENMGYAPAPIRSTYALQVQQSDRRMSQPNVHDSSRNYEDAIDASRGMIAMSQTTSRNMYAPSMGRSRGSAESYGYPPAHSNSSSISSASAYPVYLGGSIDSSISDYSSNGSEIDSVSSRTLPAPTGLVNGMPPAPSSMMSQFSSKMSSSTMKKHKCKICDKRFTRPSSLQTHMYSHTGEKPFACEVVGCGRHFSVVSNLRRHRKVHRGESNSEAGSDEHEHDHDISPDE